MKQINFTTLDYKILNNFKLLNERIARDGDSTKRDFGLFYYKKNSNIFSIQKTYYDQFEFFTNYKTKLNFDKDIKVELDEFLNQLKSYKENPKVYYFKDEDKHEYLKFKYNGSNEINLAFADKIRHYRIDDLIEIPKIDETKKNVSFKITPEFFEQLEYSKRKLRGLFDFDVSHISSDKSQLVYECENLGKVSGLKSYEFKIDSNCEKDFKITLTRRQHKLMTKLLVSNYTASLYENKYLILKNDFVPLEYVFILFSEDDKKRIKKIMYFERLKKKAEKTLSYKELNELIEEFPNDKLSKVWKRELEERKSKKVEPKPTPDSNKSEVKTNA